MTPQDRLARSEAAPALLRLHRALTRLTSVLTVMNTGAHPDDEQSCLLAWLRFGQGMRLVIACSTRGEGGQNILGPERGGLLGLLRSRELEEAARVLDSDIAWLGHGPDDPVHDFGFSKDGDQTFARWGEARITARLADAYRRWRPDVVIPTFLDVPGQHGHHRAMTRAAEAALALAAQGPDPWQVARFYLPAWSGAGGTYDDTEPPPPETLRITAMGTDPATGAEYDEIGEWSRRRHASQGMGEWRDVPRQSWSLHLRGGTLETVMAEGLPRNLAELASLAGPAAPSLTDAAQAIEDALAAFPHPSACCKALARAGMCVDAALASASAGFMAAHGHRLHRKRREIGHALAEAAGLRLFATTSARRLAPGSGGEIHVTARGPALSLDIRPALPLGASAPEVTLAAPGVLAIPIEVAPDAPDTPQFHPHWDALGGNGPGHLRIGTQIVGLQVTLDLDLDQPLALRPAAGPAIRPDLALITSSDALELRLTDSEAPLDLDLPPGWQSARHEDRLSLTPPADLPSGKVEIPLRLQQRPVLTETHGSYPHVGSFALARPALLRLLRLDLSLPDARVAYIRGTDDAGPWLRRMGLDVTALDAIDPAEDFSAYTTVLVGVVAFGARSDLPPVLPALHRFVRAGGHLVTFYQRPDQGWQPDHTPPLPLTVGGPSVRWRVTDPAAPVTVLAPDHPLLTGPNRIGPEDFLGWHKERGLYFASDWDPVYVPLLSCSDPGERPLLGALLSARVGRGRHSHCALTLHHQLDQLVPGAFRLLANLLQPA
ncbi:PIG-L family deacetylase [Paracoccus sp. NGMCC 1.201697]|uniref:PIG-L family deacetylase n=1 Tax=Paracoccus broussonetiae subsp. drimophilus TaxID=3373869 RepID=A0ABW7LFY0_9RHOB